MKNLSNLRPAAGANVKRKRLGRGIGSGLGKTSAKGGKGQTARTGGRVRTGFEGGQTPLYRRLPKVGFNNIHRTEYAIINLSALNGFEDGTVISPEFLVSQGLIKGKGALVKLLGNGKLERKLTVRVNKISASAREAVINAGGAVE